MEDEEDETDKSKYRKTLAIVLHDRAWHGRSRPYSRTRAQELGKLMVGVKRNRNVLIWQELRTYDKERPSRLSRVDITRVLMDILEHGTPMNEQLGLALGAS